MRLANQKRHSGSSSVKNKKPANTSLTSTPSTAVNRCPSTSSLKTHKNIFKEGTPIKKNINEPKIHRPETKVENIVLVHKAAEDYSNYLKKRLNQTKQKQPIKIQRKTENKNPISNFQHTNNQHCKINEKKLKEYIVDLLAPFDAKKIMQNNDKQFSDHKVKIPMVSQPISNNKVYNSTMTKYPSSGLPRASDFIQENNFSLQSEKLLKSPYFSHSENNNDPAYSKPIIIQAPEIFEESKEFTNQDYTPTKLSEIEAKPLVAEHKIIKIDLHTTLEKQKIEPTKNIEADLKIIEISTQKCNCKKSEKMPCCLRAEKWLEKLYHGKFKHDNYKKLYDVFFL